MHYRTFKSGLGGAAGLALLLAAGCGGCSKKAPPAVATTPVAAPDPEPAATGPTLSARLKGGATAPVLHAPQSPVALTAGQKPAAAEPFVLPSQPAILIWRWLEDGPSTEVELLGPDSRSWPANTSVLRGKRGLLVEVRPLEPLPVGQPIRVVARLARKDGTEAAFVQTVLVQQAPPPPPLDGSP